MAEHHVHSVEQGRAVRRPHGGLGDDLVVLAPRRAKARSERAGQIVARVTIPRGYSLRRGHTRLGQSSIAAATSRSVRHSGRLEWAYRVGQSRSSCPGHPSHSPRWVVGIPVLLPRASMPVITPGGTGPEVTISSITMFGLPTGTKVPFWDPSRRAVESDPGKS